MISLNIVNNEVVDNRMLREIFCSKHAPVVKTNSGQNLRPAKVRLRTSPRIR